MVTHRANWRNIATFHIFSMKQFHDVQEQEKVFVKINFNMSSRSRRNPSPAVWKGSFYAQLLALSWSRGNYFIRSDMLSKWVFGLKQNWGGGRGETEVWRVIWSSTGALLDKNQFWLRLIWRRFFGIFRATSCATKGSGLWACRCVCDSCFFCHITYSCVMFSLDFYNFIVTQSTELPKTCSPSPVDGGGEHWSALHESQQKAHKIRQKHVISLNSLSTGLGAAQRAISKCHFNVTHYDEKAKSGDGPRAHKKRSERYF